jgi:transposase
MTTTDYKAARIGFSPGAMTAPDPLPADLAEAHAMILAERTARLAAEVEAARAKEAQRVLDLEIERLKLEIARLRRHRFGTSSERSARLEQLELVLTELQESVAEAESADVLRAADPDPTTVRARGTAAPRKPARRPFPEHRPRTRVVDPAPATCPGCGGAVRKLGEEITESLERLPARWFVIQHVREKVSCRCCEAIREAPGPFHPIARGRAGPNRLAEVVFGKYGRHLPLHRQSAGFAREGIDLDVSTLADWVGAVAASLRPLTDAIETHAPRRSTHPCR